MSEGREARAFQCRFTVVPAHHVPDRLLRRTVTPCAPVPVYPPEQLAGTQVGSLKPLIDRSLNPARHRHCPGVAGLAFQVNDGPVVFPLLDVAEVQVHRFVPSKAAGEQDCQECAVPLSLQRVTVRCIPESLGLLRSLPISKANADLLDSLDTSYAGGQVWAEQTAVGRFLSEAPHRVEAEIDSAGRQLPRFQVYAISEDNGLTEREPRLRAVPFDELLDRVPVPSLSIDRTEAVKHRRLRLVQVRQPQDCFRYRPLRFCPTAFLPSATALLGRRTMMARSRDECRVNRPEP